MQSLLIYRELSNPSPTLQKWLEDRDQLFPVVDPKGVEHLYVDNDFPRPADITHEIVGLAGPKGTTIFPGCTLGFALYTADGDYVASYRDKEKALLHAEQAKAGAKIVVKPIVESIDGVDSHDEGWNSVEGDGTETLEEIEQARSSDPRDLQQLSV